MSWQPEEKRDLIEVGGPVKRVAPRGLLLVNPDKRASESDPSMIECGKCHKVIYKADKGFDVNAFHQARKGHYSASPECEERK
jgi:hypothetical protein